jgi:prenyltransferase beta subunit
VHCSALTLCLLFSGQCIGFAKQPGDYPDILHSFYSLAWLSMHGFVLRDTANTDDKPVDLENMTICGESVAPQAAVVPSRRKLRSLDTRVVICADRLPRHLLPAHTTNK